MIAAMNYIEAPLGIGSMHGERSPVNELEDLQNKEYVESQLTSGTNLSQHVAMQDQ